MSQKEKFQIFKEKIVRENEEKYGGEVREKYGDRETDASNRKLLNMSEEEWDEFKSLEAEILKRLEEGVQSGIKPESEAAKEIVLLHKKWLTKTWRRYTPEAHKGLAQMYIADERFTAYYDRKMPGCAMFLTQAISHWADFLSE